MSTTTRTGAHAAVPAAPSADPLHAAKPPVGVGPAPFVGELVALLVVALGVVGVQEALVRSGLLDATSWSSAAVDAVDGLRVATWVLVAGVLLVVAGVFVLPLAFRRRPRKTVQLLADTGVSVRSRDLGRLCEHALADADAVTDVSVRAGSRTLRVTATVVAPEERNAAVVEDLRTRLRPVLDALARTPQVKVSVKNEGL